MIQPVQIRNISLSEGRLMILHRSQWQRAHWPQTDHLPDLAVGQDLDMKRQKSVWTLVLIKVKFAKKAGSSGSLTLIEVFIGFLESLVWYLQSICQVYQT